MLGLFLVGGVACCARGLFLWLREKYRYEKALVAVFPQPSDAEFDEWLAAGLRRIKDYSREKLALTEDQCRTIDPCPIVSPIVWYVEGVALESLVWKAGLDGKARFGVYGVSFLWLADEHLAAFSCAYDFTRDAILGEETQEFFYRDIVSMSVKERASALSLPSGQSLRTALEFRVSVANDRYFSVVVGSERLKELTGAELVPDSGVEAAIAALREKIRVAKATPSR